jgi:predicted Zn-ribbon and HTH transcriptional regulator
MLIKCQKCGFEWDYTGKYKTKATCPDCQRKTPIVMKE